MDIDKLNEDFDSNLANNNSKTADESKPDSRPTNNSKKKLKTTKVNDGISKGRTMTGSKPDQITINPVIEAAEKTAVIGMARMNPPTTGHHKFIKKIESEAEKVGGSAHVILSHSTGSTKNPLDPEKKKEYVKKLVKPTTHVEMTSSEAPSMLHQAARIHHHAHHLVVVGSAGQGDQDRANQFHQLLTKYNGVHGPHGYYNFKSIKKVSSGDRDPDAGGVGGISGTKMREHANNGDVRSFKQGLPKELHGHAEEMIKAIQKVKDVEPIKKKKLKEELMEAFEQEMDISESGLKALKDKAFKSGINFDSIFEQYTIGYIDNLLTSNGKMTNEQAGFASVNSFIANSLFESGVPMNTSAGGFVRGMGLVSGSPEGGDSDNYISTNIGDADTQNNILNLMRQANHDKLHANFKTESVDHMFEAEAMRYGKWREVESRSGQKRKDIDLTTRNGEDRKVDDRPYRQQAIQKQVIEGKRGLWDNIHAKQERIKNGSGEHMRKAGEEGRPTKDDFVRSQKEDINHMFEEKHHGLYKYNKITGMWVHQRSVTPETKDQWLYHFKKDEPNEHFVVSKNKPNHNPLKKEDFYGAVVPSPLIHDKPTMVKKKKKVDEAFVTETEAWQKKEGKNPEGGLNRKGIQSYRNAHPGSKLSLAVTKKPSELKPGSKSANRRKSFCARMGGMKKRLTSAKTARDPDSRINKALRKWHCHEDTINELNVPAGTTGKRIEWHPKLQGIRMANGKIKRLPPGKSGSSGGGSGGGASGSGDE